MKLTKSKIIKGAYSQYITHPNQTLYDVFKNPSDAKREIYAYWKYVNLPAMHGYNLSVISGNCQNFTLGFLYPDQTTGEIMFAYITKENHRTCPVKTLTEAKE